MEQIQPPPPNPQAAPTPKKPWTTPRIEVSPMRLAANGGQIQGSDGIRTAHHS